ncbi:MAG: selU [Clostridia bacterium]|nr:selU [Clostridia bacterium]
MKLPTCNDFKKIVTDETPLIDVRAPIEFAKGAFKNAVNLPLMNDEERHVVGICYKEEGNEAAVKLGHQLVSGEIKQARINAWISHLEKYPNSKIYCFRGGLRSQIAQQWIAEAAGKEIVRLEGGYKAFRNYLISQLEPSQQKSKPILVGGCTGSGKTILLKKLQNAINLEGIANHRGSSFGKQVTPQPTQINFENNLAYALIQHRNKAYPYMILEDEGKNIGSCFLPKPLAAYFNSGDLEEVYTQDLGLVEWANYIRESLSKLKKRLGGDRCKWVIDLFEEALKEQMNSGNCSMHKNWIEMLLKDYYDPMYRYQIQKDANKVIFEGNTTEVLNYLQQK